MYCRIIPLDMDGGDHVMLVILSTTVTNAFCTDVGAKIYTQDVDIAHHIIQYVCTHYTNLYVVSFQLHLVSSRLAVQMYHYNLIHI